MNQLQAIYDITLDMQKLLERDISAKDRESVINQLNEMINQRGKYMETIPTPTTEAEKQLGKQLVEVNEQVQQKMQKIFTGLKLEMKQVKKQKSSNNKYVNPYKNVQVMDGRYMDKKK